MLYSVRSVSRDDGITACLFVEALVDHASETGGNRFRIVALEIRQAPPQVVVQSVQRRQSRSHDVQSGAEALERLEREPSGLLDVVGDNRNPALRQQTCVGGWIDHAVED